MRIQWPESRSGAEATPLRPLLILGAARSGTKFLRRLLAAHPACAVVPYGIPMVWRQGNEQAPHDALPAARCSPSLASSIRKTITALARTDRPSAARWLVEKTCANTLRVPFVRRVFPHARFIHMVRDGRDVAPSAYRRWTAAPSWTYRLRKATFLPASLMIRQGLQYAQRHRRTNDNRATVWGPNYPGLQEDLRHHGLAYACVQQWVACVEAAQTALASVPAEHVLHLRYETLVSDPHSLDRIASFLGMPDVDPMRAYYTATLRRDTIGTGRALFQAEPWVSLRPLLARTLDRVGYVAPSSTT